MATLSPPKIGPVRGQVMLDGEDAALARKLLTHRISESVQPPTLADILRESVRCYAEKLNIKA
jgi:hypothetical protein